MRPLNPLQRDTKTDLHLDDVEDFDLLQSVFSHSRNMTFFVTFQSIVLL